MATSFAVLPLPEERDLLYRWRTAYDIETLGSDYSEETRNRAAIALDRQIADGNAWVAIRNSEPVSLSAFNATLAGHCPAGWHLHSSGTSRPWIRKGIRGCFIDSGPAARSLPRRIVYQQPQCCAKLRSRRIPSPGRLRPGSLEMRERGTVPSFPN